MNKKEYKKGDVYLIDFGFTLEKVRILNILDGLAVRIKFGWFSMGEFKKRNPIHIGSTKYFLGIIPYTSYNK